MIFYGLGKARTLRNASYPGPTPQAIQAADLSLSSAHQAGSHFLARRALDGLDAGPEQDLYQGDHLTFHSDLVRG